MISCVGLCACAFACFRTTEQTCSTDVHGSLKLSVKVEAPMSDQNGCVGGKGGAAAVITSPLCTEYVGSMTCSRLAHLYQKHTGLDSHDQMVCAPTTDMLLHRVACVRSCVYRQARTHTFARQLGHKLQPKLKGVGWMSRATLRTPIPDMSLSPAHLHRSKPTMFHVIDVTHALAALSLSQGVDAQDRSRRCAGDRAHTSACPAPLHHMPHTEQRTAAGGGLRHIQPLAAHM